MWEGVRCWAGDSAVGRRRDYSGYSEGGFHSSCGPALKAKQLADTLMLIHSSAGGHLMERG